MYYAGRQNINPREKLIILCEDVKDENLEFKLQF